MAGRFPWRKARSCFPLPARESRANGSATSSAVERIGTAGIDEPAVGGVKLLDRLDVCGLALMGFVALWSAWSARSVGGDATPVSEAVVLVAGAYTASRMLGALARWLTPALLVTGSVVIWIHPRAGTYASGIPYGPLAYANATALFYVLAAAAALILARTRGLRWARAAFYAAACVSAGVVLLSRSTAASVLLLLLAVALIVHTPRACRTFLLASAVLTLAVVVWTAVIGACAEGRGRCASVRKAAMVLSEERVVWWRDAVDLAVAHPVTGIGPGRFRSESPAARGNVDAVAAHDDYLQAAAELGVPGLVLLVAGVTWAFLRLWRSPADGTTALSVASLTAAAMHASVDYSLHAPAALAAAAMLVGTAPTAIGRRGDSRHGDVGSCSAGGTGD